MGTPNPAFVFPPPPPPPPRATGSSPSYPTYSQPAYPQDNGYVSRGNHGGGGYRGRGRGDGHRGRGNYNQRGRGGSPNHNQSGYYAPGGYQAQGPYPPATNVGYGQSGYAQQGQMTGNNSYPQQWPQHTEPSQPQMGPQYYPPPPQAQPPQYQQPASQPPQPYYPQPHPASLHPPFAQQPPYIPSPQQPPYNTPPQQTSYPNVYPQPWQPPAPQQGWQPPTQHFQQQLPFGNPNHQPVAVPSIHGNPNYIDYTQSPRKRGGAFSRPRHSGSRSKAPPAVPNFLALPPKPPPQVSLDGRGPLKGQRPKKKRKFNALGLTPKKEEHEDTEEEDIDEEAAVSQTLGQKEFSIAYGDQQVILKSSEDIEKWIEERKKRYPTKARVEEKKAESKRTAEEATAARKRASRKAKEKRRKEREKQQAREDLEKRRKDKKERAAKNLAAFLEKKARQAKEAQDALENAETSARDPLGTGKKRKREDGQDENDTPVDDNANEASTTTLSGHSSVADLEISDDDTGESMSISSGSSSGESSSGSSDSDSDQPEESSSRPKGPVRVPAPKRERKSTQVCRQFRSHGSCFRGDRCRFIHDIPGPGDGNNYKSKNAVIRERKKEKKRKGIYQALVESEKEKENILVLEAIRFLGNHGILDVDEGSSENRDDGGHEQKTPDAKPENIDNSGISENWDEKGLPDLDGRFEEGNGRKENHAKKDDQEDHSMGNSARRDDEGDIETTECEEDKANVGGEHLNEDGKKDDLATEEVKGYMGDNQQYLIEVGKEEARE
ncbi:hypothetical protein FGG08_000847 [Glutinoglossum americanum]|uniref:C3H1-type domain-containing protein n=1 Tax=Glutinoglossum americanum TaxID=1670608 RepID=A0A9P8IEM6_9PEZI|nr:hypothetical protein FGG08_000847 [Glutinoglossum americanum]